MSKISSSLDSRSWIPCYYQKNGCVKVSRHLKNIFLSELDLLARRHISIQTDWSIILKRGLVNLLKTKMTPHKTELGDHELRPLSALLWHLHLGPRMHPPMLSRKLRSDQRSKQWSIRKGMMSHSPFRIPHFMITVILIHPQDFRLIPIRTRWKSHLGNHSRVRNFRLRLYQPFLYLCNPLRHYRRAILFHTPRNCLSRSSFITRYLHIPPGIYTLRNLGHTLLLSWRHTRFPTHFLPMVPSCQFRNEHAFKTLVFDSVLS